MHKESLKKRLHNHNTSFKNESKRNDTALAKYVWDLKLNTTWRLHENGKSVAPYANITKKCRLCIYEKFEILSYTNSDELLNKRSALVSKSRHVNKFLLANYKANDWHHTYSKTVIVSSWNNLLSVLLNIKYIPGFSNNVANIWQKTAIG